MAHVFSAKTAKRVVLGGACAFGGSLLLIIGTLLTIYPCANAAIKNSEPFICRQLGTIQVCITALTVIARLGMSAVIIGGIVWVYRQMRSKA